MMYQLKKEFDGMGKEGGKSTDWWDASWMLSLPSVLRIALLAPASRVLAEESPSILVVVLMEIKLVRFEGFRRSIEGERRNSLEAFVLLYHVVM